MNVDVHFHARLPRLKRGFPGVILAPHRSSVLKEGTICAPPVPSIKRMSSTTSFGPFCSGHTIAPGGFCSGCSMVMVDGEGRQWRTENRIMN